MSKELAERLLSGESLPVEDMLEAAEGFVTLCMEQRERIEELEAEIARLQERLKNIICAYSVAPEEK